MMQENAHGQLRELIPDGHSLRNILVLAGAKIVDGDGNYLGYWQARDMAQATRRQLERELRANWHPGFVKAEDW